MDKLIITNSIVTLLIVLYLLLSPITRKISFDYVLDYKNDKKKCGFPITRWERVRGSFSNRGEVIFTFHWKKPDLY